MDEEKDWFDSLGLGQEADWFDKITSPKAATTTQAKPSDWFDTLAEEKAAPQEKEKSATAATADKQEPNVIQNFLKNTLGFRQSNPWWSTMTGVPEAAMNIASGLGSFPISAAATLGAIPFKGHQEAEQIGGQVARALTYQPTTEMGQALSAGNPLNLVGAAINKFAEFMAPDEEKTQAMLRTGIATLMATQGVLGAIGRGGVGPEEAARPKEAGTPVEAPVVTDLRGEGETLPAEATQGSTTIPESTAPINVDAYAEPTFREREAESPEELYRWRREETQEAEELEHTQMKGSALPSQPPLAARMGGGLPEGTKFADATELPQAKQIDKMLVDWDAKSTYADIMARLAAEGRTTMTWKEAEQGAKNLGLTPEQLKKYSLEDLTYIVEATRETNAKVVSDFSNAQRQLADDPSPQNQAVADLSLARTWDFTRLQTGQATSLGRSLGILRKEYGPNIDITTKLQQQVFKYFQGQGIDFGQFKEQARGLDWNDPLEVNKFLQDSVKPDYRKWPLQIWLNSLLSAASPIKFGSDLITAMGAPIETIASGAPREAWWQTKGMASGILEGVRKAAWIIKTGINVNPVGDVEFPMMDAIPGLAGRIINMPTSVIKGITTGFQTIHYTGSIWRQAYQVAQEAMADGKLTQDQLPKFIQDTVDNPSNPMMKTATEEAEYRTFQKDLGKTGNSLVAFRNTLPLSSGRFLVPFYKTPTNFVKFGLERTPFYLPFSISKMVSGGFDPAEMGKIAIGATTAIAAFELADRGVITGNGPADPQRRAALLATGWQPKSVKIGNNYYSYGRLEPLAIPFSLAADAHDIWQHLNDPQQEDIAKRLSYIIGQDVLNRTFWSTASDVLNAYSDPGKYWPNFAKRMAASAVPLAPLTADTARAIDPYVRETQSILDYVRSRIPFWSEGLPQKYGATGQPIMHEGGPIAQYLPTAISSIKNEPGAFELGVLNWGLAKSPKEISGLPLNKDQYSEFSQLSGSYAKESLDDLVTSPDYQELSRPEKLQEIDKLIAKARQQARKEIVDKYDIPLHGAKNKKYGIED